MKNTLQQATKLITNNCSSPSVPSGRLWHLLRQQFSRSQNLCSFFVHWFQRVVCCWRMHRPSDSGGGLKIGQRLRSPLKLRLRRRPFVSTLILLALYTEALSIDACSNVSASGCCGWLGLHVCEQQLSCVGLMHQDTYTYQRKLRPPPPPPPHHPHHHHHHLHCHHTQTLTHTHIHSNHRTYPSMSLFVHT